jgi:putative ABC transport system permease protein
MLHDLRYALRLLYKQPGFTLVAVLALGFGIGLSTAIFNAFSAMMLRPFPHIVDEDRLVFLNSQQLSNPDNIYELSLPDFLDIRSQSKTLEGVTTVVNRTMIFSGGTVPERVLGASIAADGFAMLGAKPIRGRLFLPEEGEAKAAPVAILSHALWQRRFGGRDDVIGRVETINFAQVTIIGVMPAGFGFPDRHEMWMPAIFETTEAARSSHSYPGWARLRPGVTIDEARAELSTLAARLALEHKVSNDGKTFLPRPVREEATQDVAVLMRLMLGATIFVLLIACANVANLLLARSAARSHEIAIRVAVGATRGRIVRQVMTESLMLGLLGGGFGLLVGTWANSLLLAAVPQVELSFWMNFEFDWRVFNFAAFAAVLSSVVFGLFPALQVSRCTALEIREGGRAATGSRRASFIRQGLVVAQVALSAILLIGAGLFVRSYLKLQATEPGYDPQGVITFRVGLPPTQFKDKEVIRQFFDRLTPRLAELPGVEAVGATMMLPGQGNNQNSFLIEGRPEPKTVRESDHATMQIVAPGYFGAMGIPLRRGRVFTPTDTRTSPRVLVIDQKFAERWFGAEDPIGKRLTFDFDPAKPREWFTIVGIIGNVPQQLDQNYERGSYYQDFEQSDLNFVNYAVRFSSNPATYGPVLQKAVSSVMADIPIYNVHTMSHLHQLAYWERGFFGKVFSVFGLGALFLAALGVYGVMAYNVSQRTPEIGVRMALGATEGDILRLVSRQGLWLIGLGLACGLLGALGVTRFMASLLYGISPSDPPTYFALTIVLALVGFLACWLPARRAASVDPMVALRAE